MKKTVCIVTWLLLFFLAFPLFSENLPAWGNGVIVTEPEGSAPKPKPKPAKKSPPPKITAPAPKKDVQKEPEPLLRVNLSLQQGLILLEQRYFTRATPLLERAVLEEPANPRAWHALGRAYHARGLFPRAQEAYKKALAAEPGYPPLSRIFAYPSGDGRKPLWDPKRPARIEALPAASGGFANLQPEEAPSPQPEAPIYTPPLPHETAQKEIQAPLTPEASPVPRQVPSGRGNGKLRPFVPVRIVIAPRTEEKPAQAQAEGTPPALPGQDVQTPVYIPPSPPEGNPD